MEHNYLDEIKEKIDYRINNLIGCAQSALENAVEERLDKLKEARELNKLTDREETELNYIEKWPDVTGITLEEAFDIISDLELDTDYIDEDHHSINLIDEYEKYNELYEEVVRKLDRIEKIVQTLKNNFKIYYIRTSYNSVSTYVCIEASAENYVKLLTMFDFEDDYYEELISDVDSDITIDEENVVKINNIFKDYNIDWLIIRISDYLVNDRFSFYELRNYNDHNATILI